jgi:hypothetical protein
LTFRLTPGTLAHGTTAGTTAGKSHGTKKSGGTLMVPLSVLLQGARGAGAADRRMGWLDRCEGFRVDGPQGRIGVVKAVRRSDDGTAARALVVGRGRLRRSLVVEEADVEELWPHRRRLRVRAAGGHPFG